MFSLKTKFYGAFFLIITLFSLFLAYLNGIIRPILYAKSEAYMKMYIEKSLADALADSAENDLFTDALSFKYDPDGSIAAYSADILSAAKLRAFLTDNIITSLSNDKGIDFGINIGTLSGIPFLYGHGPALFVKLTGMNYITCDIASEFSDCGINQTLHRMILKVEAVTSIKEPLSDKKISVSTTIPISETVLIGDVPDAYTVIIRAHEEDEEDINDYAAALEE